MTGDLKNLIKEFLEELFTKIFTLNTDYNINKMIERKQSNFFIMN